jgi:hypothetical protein
MPDTRVHRGAHPEDAKLFAPDQQPALRAASADFWWLLDHGYAQPSALELVGNRHSLTQRQRLAMTRASCSEQQRTQRAARRVEAAALASQEVALDGYNLLITIESALAGAVILSGRDGTYRDLASLHGTYREVSETVPAATLIGEMFAQWHAARCTWLLDRPVSNSGRLKTVLLELAATRNWPWDIRIEFSPDTLLVETAAIVVSADSMVLDRCGRWFNAAREIVAARIPNANVLAFG